jgi:hypothetical protein
LPFCGERQVAAALAFPCAITSTLSSALSWPAVRYALEDLHAEQLLDGLDRADSAAARARAARPRA